jgi:biopolymer transport protein ExbD
MPHALLTKTNLDDDPGINMTPMIDIVFQLIIFFLLTLKFRSVDSRIDSSLPKQVGPRPFAVPVDETPRVVVKLFREDHETPDRAYTRLRVGNRWTADLPRAGDRDAHDARDEVLARLTAELETVHGLVGADALGEIKTPLPKGATVPHGDVMAVLDAFLQAGLERVTFEGARSPLPFND